MEVDTEHSYDVLVKTQISQHGHQVPSAQTHLQGYLCNGLETKHTFHNR